MQPICKIIWLNASSRLGCRGSVLVLLVLVSLQALQNHMSASARTADGDATLPDPKVDQKDNSDDNKRPDQEEASKCGVFRDYGKNYLTPNDILVKSADTGNACIKARFSLSIKIEDAVFINARTGDDANATNQTSRPIIGFLPLEHVISVEESCPEAPLIKEQTDEKKDTNEVAKTDIETKSEDKDDEDQELDMIVTFDCGKLSFTFKKDKTKIYVSAIRGIVTLANTVRREFVAVRPMFLTSDLDHHFKYNDMIEVISEVQSKTHILTATFYDTEFEAFRSTKSRDFVKPPDDKSKPFSEEEFTT